MHFLLALKAIKLAIAAGTPLFKVTMRILLQK
jgi:hypothetical protein